jgi:hypothetical protein
LAAFLFVLARYGDFGPRSGIHNNFFGWHHRDRDHDDDWSDDHDNSDTTNDDDNDTTGSKGVVKIESDHNFNLPYNADAKFAELNISGGASSYTLNDTTSQLFTAQTKEHWGRYVFWNHKDGANNYVLNFEMNGKKGVHFGWSDGHNNDNSDKADIKINPNPIWDVNVETGAAAVNFDLSKFKIRNVKLEGGAASFDVKLGQPLETTNVHVSSAAASVNISIPKGAACKVSMSGFLSSNNLKDAGFTDNGDGNYITPGFDAAKNKILMDVSGGMASFKVNRY